MTTIAIKPLWTPKLMLRTLLTLPTRPTSKSARLNKNYETAVAKYECEQEVIRKLMLIVNKKWQLSYHKAKAGEIVNISMTNMYSLVKPGQRHLVEMVLWIWFERKFRGNSLSHMTSGWLARKKPHINGAFTKFINQLMLDNTEVVQELLTVSSKGSTVEVVNKSIIKFNTPAEAETFVTLWTQITQTYAECMNEQ